MYSKFIRLKKLLMLREKKVRNKMVVLIKTYDDKIVYVY